jgi:uncharacterized SAM-binding protein YcdF (DUF218 family)
VLNDLLSRLDMAAWKPVLAALLLPPVPFLLLILVGAWVHGRRRSAGWWLLTLAAMGIWFSCTEVAADALQRALLGPTQTLGLQELRRLGSGDTSTQRSAVVVLGGGRELLAAEYGDANLNSFSLARLRYGLWLGRETALPVAYSGGVGHAQPQGRSEAEIAARIARSEFGQPLKWTEGRSRDTRENAALTLAMLRPAGVTRIVLVTHAWHMPRSMRAFEQAIAQQGGGISVVAAPIGMTRHVSLPLLRWLPSTEGFVTTRSVWREALGLLGGA